MRLIDADELMETIRAHDYPLKAHLNSTDNGMFTIGIQQAVDEQPTVDAVPVVRCRDCKHRPTKPEKYTDGFDLEFPDDVCPCNCDDPFYSWNPSDEWFCSRGERRMDKQEVDHHEG